MTTPYSVCFSVRKTTTVCDPTRNSSISDGDARRATFYGVYISHLIRFSRASISDFYSRNKILTAEFHKQEYRYHKLHKTFLSFTAVILN